MKSLLSMMTGWLLLGSAAIAAEPTVANPEWERKPSQQELLASVPYEAVREGIDGKATIRCQVTATGLLENCAILSEDPPGMGFGPTAILLSGSFKMKPKATNGRAVEGGIVTIPIHWRLDRREVGEPIYLLNKIKWLRAPSVAEWAAAYPAKARGSGEAATVVLRCRFGANGDLESCNVLTRSGKSGGFEAAAKSLTPRFTADVSALKEKRAKTQINLAIHFIDPESTAWRNRPAPRPDWVEVPSPSSADMVYPREAVAKGLKSGKAFVRCTVKTDGGLTDCGVTGEDPPGLGFGEAVKALAGVMKMNPWADEGVPMEGLAVVLPMRLNLPADPPAPPTNKP